MSKAAAVIAWVMVIISALPARANTDLSSLLDEAPSSDWVELDPTPTVLSGEFTAHGYAAYLQAVGTSPGSTEATMNSYGFRDGYAREWEARVSRDILVERVFEFADDRGAGYELSDFESSTKTLSEYRSAVPLSLPNSFGAALVGKSGRKEWRAEFRKGNLMFVVHTDADANDLSTLAVQQATWEYGNAPNSTVSSAKGGTTTGISGLVVVFSAVVAIVIVVSIVIVLAAAQRGREQRRRAAYANVQLSPDGRWWWDGQAWRPMGPPPGT